MPYETLRCTCPGLAGGVFAEAHTGRGADRSPAFCLENLSSRARTLAITLEDLSHPIAGFSHWVIWDLPAAPQVPEAIPAGRRVPELGAVQGAAYGFHRYAGPKPPRGRQHTYRFTVYVLDCALGLPAGAGKRRLLRRMEGHILQAGRLEAVFG
ncbi:MAG: YbhB/YbcL family Raf kinase inhibitor-like protein [Oscillospiraceae bacterium]|nr:YbhB/YbcL family Raf kinase inhibitor-like protein [Oscillospiraceae bacterium]